MPTPLQPNPTPPPLFDFPDPLTTSHLFSSDPFSDYPAHLSSAACEWHEMDSHDEHGQPIRRTKGRNRSNSSFSSESGEGRWVRRDHPSREDLEEHFRHLRLRGEAPSNGSLSSSSSSRSKNTPSTSTVPSSYMVVSLPPPSSPSFTSKRWNDLSSYGSEPRTVSPLRSRSGRSLSILTPTTVRSRSSRTRGTESLRGGESEGESEDEEGERGNGWEPWRM
ncbi:hypothetical protein JCM8547_007121 [Rhodosporidiobolus lusitaniae]